VHRHREAVATHVVVYKSPSCTCCGAWVDYMRRNGFTVTVHDQDDVSPIKRAAGVPDEGASCHTAQVGGYVIEGHVPVEDLRRLLKEHPAIAGLAAPGMPQSSPGMAVPGAAAEPYEVLTFAPDGHTAVFARH